MPETDLQLVLRLIREAVDRGDSVSEAIEQAEHVLWDRPVDDHITPNVDVGVE
jgi:hypothetical protein